MATKKTAKTFNIQAKITLDTGINITANTLEDAMAEARTFDIHQFIDLLGDHNDSSVTITGLFEA